MNVDHPGSLSAGTPYMMRNDGEIFTCGGKIHPYINYDVDDRHNYLLMEDGRYAQWWQWFYDHTQLENVRELIVQCLKILYSRWKMGYKWLPKRYEKEVFPHFSIDDHSFMEDATYDDFIKLSNTLNDLVNQEFLRFRIGGYVVDEGHSDEIYFRVSSQGFNWFNLIWTLVYHLQKNGLRYITATKDRQALHTKEVIKYRGVAIDHLDVDTFINLPGNPIIEKIERLVNRRTFLH